MDKNGEVKNDEERNVDEILNIMKNTYNLHYERSQNIDNKNGFFIAFHAAILIFVLDIENIKNLLLNKCENMGQVLKYGSIVFLSLVILVLAILSISLFIWSLRSRDIKYLPETISDVKYYKSSNDDFKKRLLEAYRNIAQYNDSVIEKKHLLYNFGNFITLVEIILIGISILLQIV